MTCDGNIEGNIITTVANAICLQLVRWLFTLDPSRRRAQLNCKRSPNVMIGCRGFLSPSEGLTIFKKPRSRSSLFFLIYLTDEQLNRRNIQNDYRLPKPEDDQQANPWSAYDTFQSVPTMTGRSPIHLSPCLDEHAPQATSMRMFLVHLYFCSSSTLWTASITQVSTLRDNKNNIRCPLSINLFFSYGLACQD